MEEDKTARFARFNAHAEETAEAVLNALGVAPGMTVADIGSGGGYYSLAFARLVGEGGKVLALDVDPDAVAMLRDNLDRRTSAIIEPILVRDDGAGLSVPPCDLLFVRNVIHHMECPAEFLAAFEPILKPDGRLAVIDWIPGLDSPQGPRKGLAEESIVALLGQAGFRPVQRHDFLPEQSFTIFTLARGRGQTPQTKRL